MGDGDGTMKQLITLVGKPNVGKSKTINKVYELLLAKYHDAKKDEHKTRVEIRAIITINKKRIGIASKGDRRQDVESALNHFAECKCQIILCAARTGGGSWDAVLEFGGERKYDINCIPKFAKTNLTEEESNSKCARLIAKKIESLL